MKRPLLPIACLAATLALLAGCATDDPDSSWAGTVDTLPGGGLHVRNPASGMWSEEDRWRLVEDLRIGALESGGPDQFGAIGDLLVDSAGRIYVLERQASEVRVFDPQGSHVRTFGRPGGGPGELANPLALAMGPRGRLWVVDFGNRRYEIFDTAGTRVGSQPFPGQTFGFGNVIGPDGLLYERLMAPGGGRQSILRRGYASEEGDQLQTVDTIFVPEESTEAETVRLSVSQGSSTFNVSMPVPLVPRPMRELVPGSGWWVAEATPAYRLARLGFGGDTTLVVEREYEPVPVTDEARQAALEDLPGDADLPPDRIPDRHPPFTSLQIAPDGALWVRRRTGPDVVGYDIFSSEGRYLGEVASDVPLDRFSLRQIREDAVYGILRDEMDVPYVVRLRIERGGGA